MTQNSWPQGGTFDSHATSGQSPATPAPIVPPTHPEAVQDVPSAPTTGAPQPPSAEGVSVSEAAKSEAADVAHQVSDAARSVTDTAKTEAAQVASEVKTNARELFAQAKSDLTDQAGVQQQKAAEGLRSVSTELAAMVSSSDQSGMATDLVRQAAERSSSVASWLENRDPGSLLTEVKSFARQKPGTFLLLAAGAGILAGRLTRNLSSDPPKQAEVPQSGTVPPPVAVDAVIPPAPVELPATDTAEAGVPGTYPAAPLDSAPLTGVDRDKVWPEEPVVTDLSGHDPLEEEGR